MRYRRLLLTALLALPIATSACDKSSDKKGENAGKPAAAKMTKLDKLGIEAMVPAGAEISDAMVGEGVMVQAPDLTVTVEIAGESRSATIDAAKEDADMYSPKKLKAETLSDGWALTFENKGSMGANYFVQVRREIGGKAYWCDTTGSSPEQQTNALAFCKSLK